VLIPTNMYASLSQGIEMLFLMAFSISRHSAAALVHFWFLLALPLLLLCYGTRFGFSKTGVFAAMLVFASPIAGIDGTCAYNDVALAATAFGLYYLLRLWEEEGDSRLLPLIGLLAGFCYALKYTGALAVPFAIGFVIWRRVATRKGWARPAAVVTAMALVSIAPWAIKNWIWIGNPLAPFYNNWFPNPYFPAFAEQQYRDFLKNFRDGASRLQGLLDVTLSGKSSEGLIGPVFLLTPLALLSLRLREGRRLLFAALLFLPGYWSNYGGRFLIPLLPFVATALGLALEKTPGALPSLMGFHLIFSWYTVATVYADPTAWRIRETPLRPALGRDVDQYIQRREPGYLIARMLDAFTPPGSVIFAIDAIPQAFTTRRVVVGYESGIGRSLLQALWTPVNPVLQPRMQFRFPFFHQQVRGLRVKQVGPPAYSEWWVHEFRIFNAGQEVQRRPEWRIRANPNPWEVQKAFDGSYVTKWAAGETVKPGMMIEVTFPQPLMADEVVLEAQDGQSVKLQVEGLDDEGEWSPLTAPEFERRINPELPGLRHAAMEEFKARGVRYFLIKDDGYGAMDFWANAVAWGITEIGESNGTRLYRIN
jgi:hypothetical protein